MKNITAIAFVILAFITGCENNTMSSEQKTSFLIRTVDENNQPMKAQIAKWWFSNDPKTKKTLSCKEEGCSEWIFEEEITSPLTIYVHATQVKSNDDSCWDFFEGKTEIQNYQKEVVVTLSYSATVCK